MPVDYSDIAGYYDKVRITSPDYLRFWSSRIAQYGSINKNSRVLDIGSGTGRFTLMLSKVTNSEVHAIEPSVDMLDKAMKKDKKKKVNWSKGKAEELAFPDEFFDCVYMTFVFHHIKNRKKALAEIYRILKPKGKCIFMTTSYGHIRRSPLYLFPGLAAIDLGRFPSLPEFKRILKKASFKDVHYHLDKYENQKYSLDDYLKRVKSKHVSTLSVLAEDEFKRGYIIFEKKLRAKYRDFLEIRHGVYLVSGRK
ncbi:MAG: methyltransferase domain-containing protein [Thermoplasmata archaeon]|nr:MAG: methyltransferase domain-containing protein [Thermoplasmata archaeon]